jgi:prepilin-type N-terminal cleavage/methylation domain-containing protein
MGFTLIELLVVISIIGLLSSIVLAAVVSAKNKAWDQRLISDMVSLRTAAELYRSSNNGGYNYFASGGGDFGMGCSSGFFNDSTSGGLKIIVDIQALSNGSGGFNTVKCASGPNSYAIVARLPSSILSGLTQYICMDSSGNIIKGDSTLTIKGNDNPDNLYICGIAGGGGGDTM